MVRVIKGASKLLKQMQEKMNDPQSTENSQDTKDASSSDSESSDTKEELQTTPSHTVHNDPSASGDPTKVPVTDQGVQERASASDTETIQTGDANNQITNNVPQQQSNSNVRSQPQDSSDVRSQPQDSSNVRSQPQNYSNVRSQPQDSSNANSHLVTSPAAEAEEKSVSNLTTSESSDEKMKETADPIKFEASWFDTSRRLYLEDFPLEDSGYVPRYNGNRQPQKPRQVIRSPGTVLDQEPMDLVLEEVKLSPSCDPENSNKERDQDLERCIETLDSTTAEGKEISVISSSDSLDESLEQATGPVKIEKSWFDTFRRLYLEDFPMHDAGYEPRYVSPGTAPAALGREPYQQDTSDPPTGSSTAAPGARSTEGNVGELGSKRVPANAIVPGPISLLGAVPVNELGAGPGSELGAGSKSLLGAGPTSILGVVPVSELDPGSKSSFGTGLINPYLGAAPVRASGVATSNTLRQVQVKNVVDIFPFWTTAQLNSKFLASSNMLSELEADMKSCQTAGAYHFQKIQEIYAELTNEYGKEKFNQMMRQDYTGFRPLRYGQMGPHYNSYQEAQIEYTDMKEHLGKLLDENEAMRNELERRKQSGQK